MLCVLGWRIKTATWRHHCTVHTLPIPLAPDSPPAPAPLPTAGVLCVLRWLSYTAARTGEAPPRLATSDPDHRLVAYCPGDNEKLDPRAAIAGLTAPDGSWQGGMFDRGSWTEAHPGWARTVVTGRARLGGAAVGVIAVEVSTVMLNLPADPGMPDTSERIVPQAGQVSGWCSGLCTSIAAAISLLCTLWPMTSHPSPLKSATISASKERTPPSYFSHPPCRCGSLTPPSRRPRPWKSLG